MAAEKYLFITGTSSGLGYALTALLSKNNYKVIAGVRKESDFQLFDNDNIYPMICNVSDKKDIENCYEKIWSITNGYGLFSLINNAGINYLSPFELADGVKELEVMEVNLFAPITLTRKFMPLLHQYVKNANQSAKIINVSSIGGIFGLPWESTYHASKFGLLGWSQSIRYELEALHIDVCCFLPGGMKTNIFNKSSNTPPTGFSANEHGNYYEANLKHMMQTMEKFDKSAAPAAKPAEAIMKLLGSKKMPLKKYYGADAQFIKIVNWLGLINLLKGQFTKKIKNGTYSIR